MPDELAPDAPVIDIDLSLVDEPTSPGDGEVTAPSAADPNDQLEVPEVPAKPVLSKEERDARARQGRKEKADRDERLRLEATIGSLSQKVEALVNGMSAQQQASREAYIESLAPTDQVAYLKQELAAARSAPLPTQVRQPMPREDAYQAAREHLQSLNDDLGLVGTKYEITGKEEAIARDKGQAGWYASVEALAKVRAEQLEGESQVPNPKDKTFSAEDVQKLIQREVQKATGVGRPLSATPASGGGADISSKQLKDIAASGSALKGWRGMREKVEQAREAYVKKHPVEEMAARSREYSNY